MSKNHSEYLIFDFHEKPGEVIHSLINAVNLVLQESGSKQRIAYDEDLETKDSDSIGIYVRVK